MVLTRSDVVRHCGGERVRRAEPLCRHVRQVVLQDESLEARVGQATEYVVSAQWSTRIVSACSCPLGGSCVHVAAALLVTCVAASEAPSVPIVKSAGVPPDELRGWVESKDAHTSSGRNRIWM